MKKYLIPAIAAVMLSTPGALAQQKKKAPVKQPVPQEAPKRKSSSRTPFVWEAANMYFLLTDRFYNGDKRNDQTLGRTKPAAKLRGFEGGDIRGIIKKIDEGYFDKLGINAIWFTPVVEQIHDATDEGTGVTYGFHGYWARDWSALDPNFGTEQDLAEMVQKAHDHGIRVVMDGVINHTGPVTEIDPVWPDEWVRTGPQCAYTNFENTTACTLVKNLPDVRTESREAVQLPAFLLDKWKQEGRYEEEMNELETFFAITGYPRTPRYYIIKWLTDYIRKYGIDGYRADTVKHTGEDVWADFSRECDRAFTEWKKFNPEKVLDDNSFFTVAEVYNYGISSEQLFDIGDRKINYFENGFDALINFEAKSDATKPYEDGFIKYSRLLNGPLRGKTVLNYLTSHDDSSPFDRERKKTYEAATRLLLMPGISQVYYGDETGRPINIAGATGDATLRSFMNWKDIDTKPETKALLLHWQKLGRFRRNHPAVGAGVHEMITQAPYVFGRTYEANEFKDRVVVGLDLPKGMKTVAVGEIFTDGVSLHDAYSGQTATVSKGKVSINSPYTIVLLEPIN